MDELHLLAGDFLCQPVSRASRLGGLCGGWGWSSVRAHLAGKDDGLITVRRVLDRVSCFADLFLEDRDEAFAALRHAESAGRPVGAVELITGLERIVGRRILPSGGVFRSQVLCLTKMIKVLKLSDFV